MTELLTALRFLGAFLGVWALVSVATVAVLLPWFRAQARTNALLTLRNRREDWLVAAHRVGHQPAGTR